MLDKVWVVQLLAILLVLPLVGGLVGFCHRATGKLWPYVYLVFLFSASSILTWQAPFEARWLAHAVLLCILSFTFVGLPHLLRSVRTFARNEISPSLEALPRFPRFVFYVLLVSLALEVLFAAFPGYRYDQYNYHLITPKLVALYGKLPPYMGTDHTHFTGAWEYFFTSFRSALSNDLFIQTCTTTFTFLSYVIPASAFLWQLAKPQRWLPLWFVGIPALVIYAHTELEPIISAKPDFVLVASALAIVAAQRLSLRPRLFFSFFFLLAGISFKVTWFHAGAALGVGVLLCVWRDRLKHSVHDWIRGGAIPALGGVLSAAVCIAPVFYKNTLIFGNPIHPTQAGPFKSAVATESFLTYWEGISRRPAGLSQTLINVAKVFPRDIVLIGSLWPLILLCAYWAFQALKKTNLVAPRRSITPLLHHMPWLLAWVSYLVIWGVILRFDIFNRFVAVVCIFPLLLIVRFARYIPSSTVFAAGLLTPFALNASTEVKVRRMWNAANQNYAEYSREIFSPSLQDFREARLIEKHAEAKFGKAWRDSCNVFSNKPNHYFYNTRFIAFDDQNFEYHIKAFGQKTFENCPWAYFKSINACYLIATHEYEFAKWPKPMADLVSAADESLAVGENSDLRLVFISPAMLARKLQTTAGCSDRAVSDDSFVPTEEKMRAAP